MEYPALANLALTMLEKLIPIIEAKVKAGEIPPEEQDKVRRRYEAIKAQSGMFSGSEWQPSTGAVQAEVAAAAVTVGTP